MIDGLPRNTAYWEAIANDEEAALAMLRGPQSEQTGPSMTEYSSEREAIDRVYDRLGELIQAVIAAAGAKAPSIAPLPRPYTATDRARRRKQREDHAALVARMLPHKSSLT